MKDSDNGADMDPAKATTGAAKGANTDAEAEILGPEDIIGSDEAELLEKLAQAEAQATEYLENWRRAVADLSNARKRMQREQEEMRRSAAERVLEKLIPIIDDVDRAFDHVPPGKANSDWVEGFRLIERKLHVLLQSEGVTPIPAVGQQFDPKLHHAVTHEDAEGMKEGQIIAEVAKGYKLDDKVLRPSMVRVAKG